MEVDSYSIWGVCVCACCVFFHLACIRFSVLFKAEKYSTMGPPWWLRGKKNLPAIQELQETRV